MSVLNITDFEIIGFYGIDLVHLLEENSANRFNSYRGNNTWLQELKNKVPNQGICNFNPPIFAKSKYAETDRIIRNTFSNYYVNNLMPLVFELKEKVVTYREYDDLFNIEIQSISISANGAVTVKIRAFKENGGTITCIKEIIKGCRNYKNSINEKIRSLINQFINVLNDYVKDKIKCKEISISCFEQYVSYYEIIDFDYVTKEAEKMKIKSMCVDESYLRPLVALFRMNESDFSNYDMNKISDIKDNDHGNRVDELWAINRDRLLRHHPYRKDEHNKRFFSDIVLGIEILLQQKVVLQYLNQWIGTQSSRLRKVIDGKCEVNNDKIFPLIFEMVNIYDIISDSFIIQRNTNHAFFNLIIEKSIDNMHLKDILCTNREMISDLFSLLTYISSQITTKTSINIDNLTSSMEQTGSKMKNLTIIMIFAVILQLVAAAMTIFIMIKNNIT